MARSKVRKWSNLKGSLPDIEEALSPRLTLVLQAAQDRAALTMLELSREYAKLEEQADAAKEADTARNIHFEALDLLILKALEHIKAVAGTDTWHGEGHTFSPQYMPHPLVKSPELLLEWIHETGQEEQLSLPKGRLNAIVKEALDAELAASLTPAQRALLTPGAPGSFQPPPGVEVYLRTTVHHTGPRKRKEESEDEDV